MPMLPVPRKNRCSIQFIAVAAALLFSVSLIAPAVASGTSGSKSPTSTIVDFAPTSFVAKAATKFFYSINNELKYSDQIDPHAPTLVRGPISDFLVSPDGRKIAVVVKKRLLIVSEDSVIVEVAKVASIDRVFKPFGRHFFRDDNFQWSHDSNSLYLIRDEYYRSNGSQLSSKKGELWKYDLDSRSLQLVLKPFASWHYFFGLNSRIYYLEPTVGGDLQLKLFDGRNSTNIGEPGSNHTILDLSGGSDEVPFYSFSIGDYEKALPSMGVRFLYQNDIKILVINNNKYLSVTQGKGWDGYYYCTDSLRSVFLPGGRFFLVNMPFCGNYNGQLLLDLESGRYQELPRNTVVFSTLNTMTFKGYRVTAEGIELTGAPSSVL